ncbi:RES domain protein [Legionella massiliensis]|uniref:RES domain protein n=1 Tax=Legionella massiliensis TaxID=1034943 RepID=A0A078KS51_9GAMM|nr:RES family NAD+ phosphorylase [Legionella massiliensis]CDZ77290.1 RES domain protein [Legionella massiliensis]CEE13028.1 RES domain protein [Legionella massiliensis]
MNIWGLRDGKQFISKITAEPWRVVEDQHVLSSRDLVDSIEEHDLLEELMEESKPLIEKEKNYLIFTPFRYPPLKYGSRFGSTYEPSLWYGSLQLETAFTEVAYYRLKFFEDTSADLGYVEISMTAFTAFIVSNRGIDLTVKPFDEYTKYISDKNTYEHSQLLGSHMREDNIEVFIFNSARTEVMSKNIASFTQSVFQTKKNQYVNNQQNWKCIANRRCIEFTRIELNGNKRFSFSKDYFF